MKRLLTIIALGVLVVSCDKASRESQRLIEWTFVAPATKASLGSDGTFSWNKGDQIAIWDATGGSFVTFTTPTGNGRFSAKAPANSDFRGIAYYPASIAVSTTSVSIPDSYTPQELKAGAGMPMYAIVADDESVLRFKHLGAFLKVQIVNAPSELNSLAVSSDGLSLSGSFTLADDSGYKVVQAASGSAAVGVSIGLGIKKNVCCTLPVPVGTYPLSLVAGSDNQPGMISRHTDPVTFERAHIYTLETVDMDSDEDGSLTTVACESFVIVDDDSWE